ncbi:IPT/TIG domain-containing protein [Labilibaculum manganireducens]|uniref:IPT/TIG domain-containing protein n=1 Tax=Labilibaculum manganireducens TaxID=1940525 RepID=UPI0029F56FE1|nr:IPT/TIG domain-containing protein [Labilibaculum manganireducens]
MKNNIYNRLRTALICFTLLAGIFVVSCDKDDDNGGSVELYSFGPSPVLRGSDIHFIGQDLDLVTSVVLPDNIEVSNITVVSSSEITITVPQEAEPGFVTLKYKGGSITTKSRIGYTEPYSITSILPVETAVREGEEVTISGDYLNNIVKVVFQGNASVDSADFVSQSRKEIVVKVPKEAVSGKIIVEDIHENQLYSDLELSISQPTLTSFSPTLVKAGENVMISGANLDLVSEIIFSGDSSVVAKDFVSVSSTSIEIVSSAYIQDGPITLKAYSGVEVISSESVTTVIPSALTIAAVSRYRAGLEVLITGSDLDLTTSVQFTGGTAITDFTYNGTGITVVIPNDAMDGVVVLNTASGKSASTDAIVLVKPIAADVTPNPVDANNDITITGTDLDLVKSVTFGNDLTVDITPESSTSITVTVPMEATTGELILTMINGAVVNTSSVTVNSPDYCYIPVLPDSETEINSGKVFSIDVVNGGALTEVKVDGNTTSSFVEGTNMYVFIPSKASGKTELTLISATGSISYTISVIGVSSIETVIMNETHDLGSWANEDAGGAFRLYKPSFNGVKAGSILKFYFTVSGTPGRMQINDANWGQQAMLEFTDEAQTSYEMELTQGFLDQILNTSDGWSETAAAIQGQNLVISKVTVITFEASASETIWTGSQVMPGDWSGNIQLSADLFASANVGDVIHVKSSDVQTGAQGSFKNGSWTEIAAGTDYFDITGDFELTITADILTSLQSGGLIISGHDYTATEVSIRS